MPRLEEVAVSDLEETLVELDGYREVQRLLAALIYKRGPSVPMIADWFDKREATIYGWFDRLESAPIDEAIRDASRPGRPPKLDGEQHAAFEAALQDAPTDHGQDAAEWTPAVAQAFLQDQFGIEYTRRHVRRLLKDTGAG